MPTGVYKRKEKPRDCAKCGSVFMTKSRNAGSCPNCRDKSRRTCKSCGQIFKVESSSQYKCFSCRNTYHFCACGCGKYVLGSGKYTTGHWKRAIAKPRPKVCVICKEQPPLPKRKTCSDSCLQRSKSEGPKQYYLNGGKINSGPGKWKAGRYKGIYYRSSWEIEFAKTLERQKIDFKFESKRFDLGSEGVYISDFYIPKIDFYVEIKGYLTEKFSQKVATLGTDSGTSLLIVNQPPPYDWIFAMPSGGEITNLSSEEWRRVLDVYQQLDEAADA